MELGAGPDDPAFFFTLEMTNCRFSVLCNNNSTKVAHVAGNIVSPGLRDKAEREANFVDAQNFSQARRLSISNSSDRRPFKQPMAPKKHEYYGQAGSPDKHSSAFVFGQRKNGEWQFNAQVTKGVLTESYYKGDKPADLTIIDYVDFNKLK